MNYGRLSQSSDFPSILLNKKSHNKCRQFLLQTNIEIYQVVSNHFEAEIADSQHLASHWIATL